MTKNQEVINLVKAVQGKGLSIVESELDGSLTLVGNSDESSEYLVQLLEYDETDVKMALAGKLGEDKSSKPEPVAQLPQLPNAQGDSPYILCKPETVLIMVKSIADNQNIIDLCGVIDELNKHVIQEDFWLTVFNVLSFFANGNIEPTKDRVLTALKIIYTGESVTKLFEL